MPDNRPGRINERRKEEHLKISLSAAVGSGVTTGFEEYLFLHQALPEIDMAGIDLSTTLFGKNLAAPIIISANSAMLIASNASISDLLYIGDESGT